MSDQEITTHVSNAVTEMLSEYRETGKINFKDWKTEWQKFTKFENGERKPKRQRSKRRKPRPFKYHMGAKNPPEDFPVTIEGTGKALEAILRRLNNLPGLEEDNLKTTTRKIKKAAIELAEVHNNNSDLIKNIYLNPKEDL